MTDVKKAYSTSELAKLHGVAPKNVLARAKREEWECLCRSKKQGGAEWLVASMPEATRLKIAAALATELAKDADNARRKQFVNTPLGEMPVVRRDRAEARALAVQMARRYRHNGNLKRSTAYEIFAHQYNSGAVDVPAWARAALPRLCRASLINWEDLLQKEGAPALAGKYGLHRKGSGAMNQPYIQDFCLAHIYQFPHSEAGQIHKGLEARLALQKRPERLPSLRRVQAWYKAWKKENEELFACISNPDDWRNKFRVSFGDAAGLVWELNQEWEMDSTPADLLLSDNKRHTIVACIDLYSRRVTFHVSRTSSSHAVATCLRKAITAWGVPGTVRTDNGQDYVARHFDRVLLDMNIHHDLCDPFSPQQKPFVERVFKSFLHDNMELLAGYTGHNVAERKALEARKSFARRMMDKKDRQTIELNLSPEELQEVCDRWANDTYMHRKHSKLGCTPYEQARAYTGEIKRVEDEEALRLLFLPCPGGDGSRLVGKKGVKLFGRYYQSPELALHQRRYVQPRVDDAEHGRIYVYSLEGDEFICTATASDTQDQKTRQATAKAAKRLQTEALSEGRAAMKAAAKAANVKEIAYERVLADAERARRIEAEQPLRAETMNISAAAYSTEALEGAAKAARAANAPYVPAPVSEAEKVELAKAKEVLERAKAGYAPPSDSPEKRYLRAHNLWEAMMQSYELTPEQHKWLKAYRTTPEFKAQYSIHQFYGEDRIRAIKSMK